MTPSRIFSIIFAGLTGFIFSAYGYGVDTWQYWVFVVPLFFWLGWRSA